MVAARLPRTKIKIRAGRLSRALAGAAFLGAASLGPGAAAEQARAAETAGVFVPSFWESARPSDRPDLGGLTGLRFATEDDDPPFAFLAPDGTLVGFDVDLARALCEELSLACTIQPRRYDTVVGALNGGAIDAAIASMAITPQALESVEFTAPYYKTPARFVARRETPMDDVLPETVAGRRIGVQHGTAHEAYLERFFPAADLRRYGSSGDARAALLAGAVDLLFGDGIALSQWLATPDPGRRCAFVGGPFTEARFFGEGAGIAVRKGNAKVRAALDYALARLATRGIYGDLYLKYFPIGVY